MHKQTKKELFWEICRFLLVGGIATLVDYAVFWLFDAVIFPIGISAAWDTLFLVLSTALGFCAGLTVNWILSVRVVFLSVKDDKTTRSKKAFAVFALIGVIGLALTELGVVLLVSVLPEIRLFGAVALFGTAWEKWLAKAIMTCLILVWNYLGRKLFVFKTK
ncbi:MAG: GtrA family protein [Clostridia bacterium]|nr:GtrA family protein [Clostridia bacterium]